MCSRADIKSRAKFSARGRERGSGKFAARARARETAEIILRKTESKTRPLEMSKLSRREVIRIIRAHSPPIRGFRLFVLSREAENSKGSRYRSFPTRFSRILFPRIRTNLGYPPEEVAPFSHLIAQQ